MFGARGSLLGSNCCVAVDAAVSRCLAPGAAYWWPLLYVVCYVELARCLAPGAAYWGPLCGVFASGVEVMSLCDALK